MAEWISEFALLLGPVSAAITAHSWQPCHWSQSSTIGAEEWKEWPAQVTINSKDDQTIIC